MEYTPPPFFRQGPSAVARLVAFAALSLLLLVLDARFKVLERVRFGVATLLYPMQRAARAPGEAASGATGYLERQRQLMEENARLKQAGLTAAERLLRAAQVESENTNLRAVLAMRERLPVEAIAAETLYEARDPFTRKVVIDKGVSDGIKGGQVVVDGAGVMGQVTRAYPFVSEVSLLTDRDQAIPVQVVRNGLRAIAYGTPGGVSGIGDAGAMELRFLAANADVREGDVLVTSGIDGTYLAGLPVASVVRIEREAGYAFAKILCKPAAGIDRFGQVLVLKSESKALPAPPPEETEEKGVKGRRPKRRPEVNVPNPAALPTPAAKAAAAAAKK
ncbi:MAG TPA: rod shape-determining protein MreC [Burkholderiales bacterium]|jgi:rod shape-determining protein MreC|nr:rod shape-determining protein MreC [Burkholderiales bacterium]